MAGLFKRPMQFIMAEPGTNPIEEPVAIAKRRRDPFWLIMGVIMVMGLCGSIGWIALGNKSKPAPAPTPTAILASSSPTKALEPVQLTKTAFIFIASPTGQKPMAQVQDREVTRLVDRQVIQTVVQQVPVNQLATVVVFVDREVTRQVTVVVFPSATPTPSQTPTPVFTPTITPTATQTPTLPPSATPDPLQTPIGYFPILFK
jgi:hypothetical protein